MSSKKRKANQTDALSPDGEVVVITDKIKDDLMSPLPSSKPKTRSSRKKSKVGDSGTGFASSELLEKIDQLFACNVGHYISLPQLIVVGDQSSGKSSVLEGLTDLPFPRDVGLCTRFATQIIFRRAQHEAVLISIIPGREPSNDHAEKMRKWTRELKDLDADAFSKIVNDAQTQMGIKLDGSKSFSDDVLKIELTGPQLEHFSVIDVPGIFRNKTKGKTSEKDIELVREMVQSYMESPRSIMLAVIAANVDVANQEILGLAEKYDPSGERTIGILTKPDLVGRGSEPAVIGLMDGSHHNLLSDWHVVRNPGQAELEDEDTNRHLLEEKFFREEKPWRTIPKRDVGVAALRIKLQDALHDHVKRGFESVRMELAEALDSRRAKLHVLGPSRASYPEQLPYLITVATNFQHMLIQAMNTLYNGHEAFDRLPALKLATEFVTRNDTFSDCMAKSGVMYDWHHPLPDAQKVSKATHQAATAAKDAAASSIEVSIRAFEAPAVVADLIKVPTTILAPQQQGILQWLDGIYAGSRGLEIGTFQPAMLTNSMRTQTQKWPDIALGYISDMLAICHNFILQTLEVICPQKDVRDRLVKELMPHLKTRYQAAIDRVLELLEIERSQALVTVNPSMNANIDKARDERFRVAVGSMDSFPSGYNVVQAVLDKALKNLSAKVSNREHVIQEIHDALQAYYTVARQRFVDYVCHQAAGRFIFLGPDTPLKVFTPDFVAKMSQEKVQSIAEEDRAAKRKRENLAKEIDDLERGEKVLG